MPSLKVIHDLWSGTLSLQTEGGESVECDSIRIDGDGVASVMLNGSALFDVPVTEVGWQSFNYEG